MKFVATLVLGLVLVSAAAAVSLKPRATITTAGHTQTFEGSKCVRVLNGFRLKIGRLNGPRFLFIQYARPLTNGDHRGAVIGAHFGGKFYASPTADISFRNRGKIGVFSGRWDKLSGGGFFHGTYRC